MAEHILATLLLKKTKSLAVIEPLYCTVCHLHFSFSTYEFFTINVCLYRIS